MNLRQIAEFLLEHDRARIIFTEALQERMVEGEFISTIVDKALHDLATRGPSHE